MESNRLRWEGELNINKLLNIIKTKKSKDVPSVEEDFIIDTVIRDACLFKASDIHLEPGKNYYRIRVRIDGKLHERVSGLMIHYQNMVNRIKYLANMNIAEKRAPQDGALRWSSPEVDIRISTMPMAYGEKCVIRILKSQDLSNDFNSLGIPQNVLTHFLQALRKDNGLILVAGPTGSGKSTTLYTALHHLNNPQHNIITIEDPIEYMIQGINQMQIHQERSVTFSSALRSILRQDPDIIMIGEIRDHETADIAIRASLTGHKILSTLHTNNAVSALYRLLDMDIQPYLAVQGISAVVAQRLVRKVCTNCTGSGCDICLFTGYCGRTGVFEIITMDEAISQHIMKRGTASELTKMLKERGWLSMLDNAQILLSKGVIDEQEYQELSYSI
ncbi:GspE/PulE family protein [Desulfuribacillus alkaliarsenatis]|uniref:Bacterial type II secretion system protein E domain-containing protein n=1 Tax=Desulfuribacillus alkaliarsenatis TaxID=766136 RepID=A0A1E5G5G7_9FIRM|nr:GspE/PulE family protein [Desulfuribacillus alkaliarsenatis]OEF98403.1 hypothetical protein BHF68_01620 [Desulfuribacillus alkaliarsenatis]